MSLRTPEPALAALLVLAGCMPADDRPLHSRVRRGPTGELVSDRPAGAYPYPEQLKRVRLGMAQREVYLLLGEPMRRIEGAQPTWIYGEPGRQQLLLTFDGGRLAFMDPGR